MAFTGYPDANKAMGELSRVLKADGRLVMIDLNYPHNDNRGRTALVAIGRRFGDQVREVDPLFRAAGLEASDHEIGGFGASTSTSPPNERRRTNQHRMLGRRTRQNTGGHPNADGSRLSEQPGPLPAAPHRTHDRSRRSIHVPPSTGALLRLRAYLLSPN